MEVQHLLVALRSDAREIARSHPKELERLRASSGKGDDPVSAVAAYDYQAFQELLNRDMAPAGGTVDDAALAGFRELIDRYMDTNAPDDAAFKDYVRTVAVYLAFIARLPLHPPGMRFAGDKEIVLVEGTWRCPGKREFVRDPMSLCRYCVCRSD
jgi:uncharacterized protein (UPF0305 family)